MPVLRISDKLVYYAHVPKCAGTSVEAYLEARFGQLAFLDRRQFSWPKKTLWSVTSPQHIDVTSLERLFPSGFFDNSFAVVRHPVSRISSAFAYNRDTIGRIFKPISFDMWLWRLEYKLKIDHHFFDNHFLPQADLIPEGTAVFRLEDSLEKLVAYIDALSGDTRDDLKLGHENKSVSGISATRSQIRRIERIYAKDYEALGYERQFPDG